MLSFNKHCRCSRKQLYQFTLLPAACESSVIFCNSFLFFFFNYSLVICGYIQKEMVTVSNTLVRYSYESLSHRLNYNRR